MFRNWPRKDRCKKHATPTMPRRRRCQVVLSLEPLEDRLTPSGIQVVGDGPGGPPKVHVLDAATHVELFQFLAYDQAFTGGVHVALGDINADGVVEIITAPGRGGGPDIKVFDSAHARLLSEFFAFDSRFTGGVTVASGDVNNDGYDDIVLGAGRGGGPNVLVVSGKDRQPLFNFMAYDTGFTGGVQVATGDVNNDDYADIITGAGAGGGPNVRIFDGATGAILANYMAYDPNFTGGVSVAAGDLGHTGLVHVVTGAGAGGGPQVRVFPGASSTSSGSFFAFDPAFTGGVSVGTDDIGGSVASFIMAGAGPGGGPELATFNGQTFQRTSASFVDNPNFTGGIAVAGSAVYGNGNNEILNLLPAIHNLIPPSQRLISADVARLGLFQPGTATSPGFFNKVTAPLTNLTGANVYVLIHGWADGYLPWVQGYQEGTGLVLKVWETDPNIPNSQLYQQYNTSHLPPAGNWIFQGSPGPGQQPPKGIVVSIGSLSQQIVNGDPKAVVLAYSWIDDSATDSGLGYAYTSESKTELNGMRLANALQQVLPASFTVSGGKLDLIGHSHGTKVATVAAVALQQQKNIPVTQLTILDSPESGKVDGVDAVDRSGAANFDWLFLQSLTITRQGSGTFVDNYISEFGIPFNDIAGKGLDQVVDVKLDPLIYANTDFGDRHLYAPNWYSGATTAAFQNATQQNALGWSPLINSVVAPALNAGYTQSWTKDDFSQANEYLLTGSGKSVGTPTVTPQFTTLQFKDPKIISGSGSFDSSSGTVTLNESQTPSAFQAKFDPGQIKGIAFNYQFTAGNDTAQLSIGVNGKIYFIMIDSEAGAALQQGTLSVGFLKPIPGASLTISLMGSGSDTVTVSNLRSFTI